MTNQEQPVLTDIQPHIFYALYYWLMENGYRPHIHVSIHGNIKVPPHLAHKKEELFNINDNSVGDFKVDKDGISFKARFSSVSHNLYIPWENLNFLIAEENRDLVFTQPFIPVHMAMIYQAVKVPQEASLVHPETKVEVLETSGQIKTTVSDLSKPGKGSHLRLVKG